MYMFNFSFETGGTKKEAMEVPLGVVADAVETQPVNVMELQPSPSPVPTTAPQLSTQQPRANYQGKPNMTATLSMNGPTAEAGGPGQDGGTADSGVEALCDETSGIRSAI